MGYTVKNYENIAKTKGKGFFGGQGDRLNALTGCCAEKERGDESV